MIHFFQQLYISNTQFNNNKTIKIKENCRHSLSIRHSYKQGTKKS